MNTALNADLEVYMMGLDDLARLEDEAGDATYHAALSKERRKNQDGNATRGENVETKEGEAEDWRRDIGEGEEIVLSPVHGATQIGVDSD